VTSPPPLDDRYDARLVARARERFLASGDRGSGDLGSGDLVRNRARDPILTSWRRSRSWGVSVDLPELPFHPDIDTDNRLVRAARPVLERVQTMLADTAVSVVLADGHANVLYRWTGDPSLNHDLDAVWLAPGFSYAEPHAGTNAIGTALEEKRAAYVFGSEHFSGRLQSLSCAAAPIRHALTGRTEGVVDVTCRRSDASPLMLALVRQAAAEIEQRLIDEATAPERALLRQFLVTNRGADQAVLTVGSGLVIANPTAFQLLGPDDHALVRDRAAELMASPRQTSTKMFLSSGQPATLHCSPVMSPAGMAGAIVEVSVRDEVTRSAKPSRSGPPRPLPGVAGRSPAWLQACQRVESQCRARSWLLVTGEPGVGKCAIAEAAHRRWFPTGPLAVIDVADDGDANALEHIERHLFEPSATIVLRHVDRMSAEGQRRLAELLDEEAGDGGPRAWVVATSVAPDPGTLLAPFPSSVPVPPLRHRVDDIRDLVTALIEKYAPRRPPTCTSETMQTLLRAPWPGNVAQLERVVKLVLSRRRSGEIRPADLPPECHATSPMVLTHWQALERDAITEALIDTDGDRARAAHRLGISRATVYRKIHAFGIVVEAADGGTGTSR
jgi:transcriptional regulator of acetoin/glycerol metabolism